MGSRLDSFKPGDAVRLTSSTSSYRGSLPCLDVNASIAYRPQCAACKVRKTKLATISRYSNNSGTLYHLKECKSGFAFFPSELRRTDMSKRFTVGDKVIIRRADHHAPNFLCLSKTGKPDKDTKLPCVDCEVKETRRGTVSGVTKNNLYTLRECDAKCYFCLGELESDDADKSKRLTIGSEVELKQSDNVMTQMCRNPKGSMISECCKTCDVAKTRKGTVAGIMSWGINKTIEIKSTAVGGKCRFPDNAIVGEHDFDDILDDEIESYTGPGWLSRGRSWFSSHFGKKFRVKTPQIHAENELPEVTDDFVKGLEK